MEKADSKLNKVEREILAELSRAECFKHIKWLYDNVPERPSGTPEGERAVEYVKKTLKGYGLETNVYELPSLQSLPGPASVKVLQPHPVEIRATSMTHIPSTPPEGITGEVVYVGDSAEADFEGKDVTGKITLARLGYRPAFCEKVRLAEVNGAIAQIQLNWGLEEQDVMSQMMARSVWGNPTPETIGLWPKIPAATITKKDGEYLRRLIEEGKKPVVSLVASSDTRWKKVHIVEARIHAKGREAGQFVLLGGHLDAWGKGVTCNATGDTTMIEMGRVLSRYAKQFRRSLRICFWPGHEDIMAGSTWYVDHFWKDLRESCVLYFNTDSTGMKEATHYMSRATEDAEGFHRQTIQDIFGVELPYLFQRASKIGDQSFFGIGIPSLLGRMVQSPELQKRWNNATLGWWYHSPLDDLDALDMNVFEYNLKGYAVSLYRLLTAPIVPMEFTLLAKSLKDRIEELASEGKGVIDLGDLSVMIDVLLKRSQRLKGAIKGKGDKKNAPLINSVLVKLSRILLPIAYTYWGVYEQDHYGAEYLSKPLPGLYWVTKLAKLPRDSEPFILYTTRLVRERNKICDALKEAIGLIDDLLKRL